MKSNNLTALLTALAVIPLYFKEPSQPAPEKWWIASAAIYRDGSTYILSTPTPHTGTQARKGPTGDWIVSQEGAVLSRHKTEEEAISALMDVQAQAIAEMGMNGFCPFQVDDDDQTIGEEFWFRKQVK